MDCCGGGTGAFGNGFGSSCAVDLEGVSIREVMQVLRGVSKEEIISQLEGIGFCFDESNLIRQLNKLDTEGQRRVMRGAG